MPTDLIPEPGKPQPLGEFMLADRRHPAVYFLFRRGEVVYVGQSRTLKSRIDTHLTEGVKEFDAVAFIRCTIDRLTKIESHYIRLYNPKYNDCAVARKVRERESWCQDVDRRPSARRRLALKTPDQDVEGLETIDAAECFLPDHEIGAFLQVSDRDVAEWQREGRIKDKSILGLLGFMASNSGRVAQAQQRFEEL